MPSAKTFPRGRRFRFAAAFAVLSGAMLVGMASPASADGYRRHGMSPMVNGGYVKNGVFVGSRGFRNHSYQIPRNYRQHQARGTHFQPQRNFRPNRFTTPRTAFIGKYDRYRRGGAINKHFQHDRRAVSGYGAYRNRRPAYHR